jgi:Mg/Co/Ni transporter MgtE
VHDRLKDVLPRITAPDSRVAVVLNEANIVLGLVSGDKFDSAPEMSIAHIMEPGPTTLRPHMLLTESLAYMQRYEREYVTVTTSDGKFLGILWRQDAERAIADR